jgi:pimeloyl-ACP methyl ester carboxylesterase
LSFRLFAVAFFIFTFISSVTAQTVPTAPPQPATGPASAVYPHASVNWTGPYYATAGDKGTLYYMMEPAAPKPASAPVVVFLHGWLANDPNEYAILMGHIARKGHTVIWPLFDDGLITTWQWVNNASKVVQDSIGRLNGAGFVKPQYDTSGRLNLAVIGHSAGGYVAAGLAARSTRWFHNLPRPKALLLLAPGGKGLIPTDDLTIIDPSTKIIVTAGEDDDTVCNITANHLWSKFTQIPDANRDYLLVRSDTRGQPQQIANHYFINTLGRLDTAAIDARDYYVTFKLSVALLDCAFRNVNCSIALGGTTEQLTMGKWSDGVPLRPMTFIVNPNDPSVRPPCLDRWQWPQIRSAD